MIALRDILNFLSVYFSSMPDHCDINDMMGIVDPIDDAVIANSNPP